MREEVREAANFLTNLVKVRMSNRDSTYNLNRQQLEHFKCTINDMLHIHYQQHWFPTNPNKGSGYRCIRINHKMDPIISKAGSECGFQEDFLRLMFPDELTMWIDPEEVSYRIGENGSICILYEGSCDNKTPLPNKQRQLTPSMQCNRNANVGSPTISNSSEDDDTDGSCTPMSISPPSCYERMSSCKGELRYNNSDFGMESGNGNFMEYVAS